MKQTRDGDERASFEERSPPPLERLARDGDGRASVSRIDIAALPGRGGPGRASKEHKERKKEKELNG